MNKKIKTLLDRTANNCSFYHKHYILTGDEKYRFLMINELGCFRGITYMLSDVELVRVYTQLYPDINRWTDSYVKR